jgi:hypothetical protein
MKARYNVADNVKDRPEAIEQDIERTQDAIGDTIGKIEEKLSPSEVTRSILGDSGQEIAREAFHLVRQNPVPAAMIVVGAVWLVATSDSPLIKRVSDRLVRRLRGEDSAQDLRPRDEEPAPIGPPPAVGDAFDRRAEVRTEA